MLGMARISFKIIENGQQVALQKLPSTVVLKSETRGFDSWLTLTLRNDKTINVRFKYEYEMCVSFYK